jgi:hypothetical protein
VTEPADSWLAPLNASHDQMNRFRHNRTVRSAANSADARQPLCITTKELAWPFNAPR